eukprot:GHVP01049994.1.p1 GENE.GHVP01049994.1~~GHVP01049994.1.p1  ORF type:complete len:527 (+),score=116.82 GHVP01049994.1:1766-3346(+)
MGNMNTKNPEINKEVPADEPISSSQSNPKLVYSNAKSNVAASSGEKQLKEKLRPDMFIEQQSAIFSDRYQGLKVLGKGSFGEVILCRERQSKSEVAVKVISKKSMKNAPKKEALLKEVDLLKQLDHPNIMKLFEFFEDSGYYYLVSELYTGGELFDEIISRKKFSEIDAAKLFRQIMSGIAYMHKMNIVHRDLKPENLLLADKTPTANIKIIDFGLSTYTDPQQRLKDKIGTAYYIAPEVLQGNYSEKCDIWSAGVILYILLSGCPPFHGSTEYEILQKVKNGTYNFNQLQWKNTSPGCRELIRQMLTFQPSQRISANTALQHVWLTQPAADLASVPQLYDALVSMKSFKAEQTLAQAALLYICSKLTTEEENKTLTTIFQRLDQNGDGELDRAELLSGYRLLAKEFKSKPMAEIESVEIEVDKILDAVDMDKSGTISYSEFLAAATKRELLLSKERLQRSFKMFDRNGDGKVSKEELMKIFEMGELGREECEKMIDEIDLNSDGEIEFQEFESMLLKLNVPSVET